jgi:hypothetical protein
MKTNQQADAEEMLIRWASINRDDIVLLAYLCNVSKNRIAQLTGIARSTIDRILEKAKGES